MKRKATWTTDMNAAINRIRDKPFAWGVTDCCTVPADIVLAMTDEDFLVEFRGRYNDADTAYQALLDYREGGLPSLFRWLAKKNDWAPVSPNFAQRGDVLLLGPAAGGDRRFGGMLGICTGAFATIMSEHGLAMTAMRHVVLAWHIK